MSNSEERQKESDCKPKVRKKNGTMSQREVKYGRHEDCLSERTPQDERKCDEKKSKGKSSRARTKKSKTARGSYQRSMSAFSMFDTSNEEHIETEDQTEMKEDKKKDKFSRSSLRRKKKNSTVTLPMISIDTDGGTMDGPLLDKNGEVGTKDEYLEISGVQLRGKKNDNGDSIFKRLSWRRPENNDDESGLQNQGTNVLIYDDFPMKDSRDDEDPTVYSSDLMAFGCQPSTAFTESTPESSTEKNHLREARRKSVQNFQYQKKDIDLSPPPISHLTTLSKCGSLNALNETSIIENDMLPQRKLALSSNCDLSNQEEEGRKSREKEKEKGKKEKLFDFKIDKVKERRLKSTANTSPLLNERYVTNTKNDSVTNAMNDDNNNNINHDKKNRYHGNNGIATQAAIKQKSNKKGGFVRRFTTGPSKSILQDAIKNSDADALQKLLQDPGNRTEINSRKAPGVTVFHQACVFGDVQIIQMLLSNGADVNLKTWSKLSPVKIATTFGHFDAAKLLLESGAEPTDIINGYQEEQKLDS